MIAPHSQIAVRGAAFALAAIAAVSVLAGCAQTVSAPASPTASSTSSADSQAQFVGLCGQRTDSEITAATGAPDLTRTMSDPLTCRWENTETTVTFRWLRGSGLADYRHEVAGTRADTEVADRPGFRWFDPTGCEIAVGTGASDFIAWKVEHSPTDPCTAAVQLAAATLGG
ncbi:DUF3558 family protein [Nocardia sp. NPDC058519]|uniref:DUF3558 family protein n=1 Tax=Nocardia sp. NPDC058519 TaxID=3346535 RepID=UPI0036570171